MATYNCNQLISGKPQAYAKGNPEGSEKSMCHILLARKTQFLIVNDKEVELLAGCMLGDGYVSKEGAVCIEHSDKQKEYLEWKYGQLQSLVSGKLRKVSRNRIGGTISYSYRFKLKQYFKPWRKMLYPEDRKSITQDFLMLLTPLSLAVWYMDDGCLKSNYQLVLCTDDFSEESIENLRKYLKQKWNIETRIKLKREPSYRTYQRLTIGSYSLVRFFDLIRPHIAPSMLYKISDPVTTQSIKRRHRT
ncbi:hypothetical protein A2690_01055 [Candidatus Roizmanbacteria bacterium RIFCSPHIGHO2_01_FULL_39_12b]|uniref:Homing endonuclease LAGLIDADG domain-containing protein n=2 Tax=Patescibacteria group TaxID=1783273 RepID=A0A1F8GX09_9BACT|nr:MAG: hypothetical protein A2690_01055 [Candidatus Roizmanbacteria bacterium RIFCSPHIGHO2_01_FULL_39_12b]OGN29821.1 MAG: hypothetical protein A3A33_00835 [Candidatus Yanofskybacteria bacterium RIFCSPLOWO2_01_FULL_49_25]